MRLPIVSLATCVLLCLTSTAQAFAFFSFLLDADIHDDALAIQGSVGIFGLIGRFFQEHVGKRNAFHAAAVTAIRDSVYRVLDRNGNDRRPDAVVGQVIGHLPYHKIRKIFEDAHLSEAKKWEALNSGDATVVGRKFLEAVEEKVRHSTHHLSAKVGGKRTLQSAAHGTFLRSNVPNWTVDMVDRPPQAWEYWYIEDFNGTVAIKGHGAGAGPGQFLRAVGDDSVNLGDKNPHHDKSLIWKPFQHSDYSWSFLSIHGTWLSGEREGTLRTVAKCREWERFWINTWY